MLNFEKIVDVLVEELGEAYAECICDAVGSFLMEGKKNHEIFSTAEDEHILYCLFLAMDQRGLNYLLPQHDPLRCCAEQKKKP